MSGGCCSGRGSGPADFPPAGTIRVCCSIFSVPADKHPPTCVVGCSRYRLEMRRPAACICIDAGSFIWTTSEMFGSSVTQANRCRRPDPSRSDQTKGPARDHAASRGSSRRCAGSHPCHVSCQLHTMLGHVLRRRVFWSFFRSRCDHLFGSIWWSSRGKTERLHPPLRVRNHRAELLRHMALISRQLSALLCQR